MNPALTEAFPALQTRTYLNSAAESAFMASHETVLLRYAAEKAVGEPSRPALAATEARCRALAAQLLHVSPEEIAFLASTARGIDAALKSLDWRPGDNMVLTDLDYPSNGYAAQLLRRQGVEMRLVPTNGRVDLGQLDERIDSRTRVVVASLVSYKTGFTFDLPALGELVHRKGALLLVDGIQAAGLVPIYAEHCDFLTAGTYKWLLGAHGLGIFYVNRRLLPSIHPPYVAGRSVVDIFDPQRFERYDLLPDARRYEEGMPNYLGLMVLENALQFLLAFGIENVTAHVRPLVDRLYTGLREMGLEVLSPADPAERAGIISIAAPHCGEVMALLKERNVFVWGKDGRVRMSAHLYNDMTDVERCLSELDRLQSLLHPMRD